jgi:Tfp pilus assembly protein FimT
MGQGERGILSGRNGSILLDLLLAAVIAGILAMIGLPLISSIMGDSRLNGATTELVSGLQYAANLAVRYQRPFGLVGDVTANSFRVTDTNPQPNAVPPAQPNNQPPVNELAVVFNPFEKAWYVKDFDDIDTYRGVSMVSAPAGNQVIFYPDGHTGLTDSSFVMGYGERQKTVTVSGTTGRVTVQ